MGYVVHGGRLPRESDAASDSEFSYPQKLYKEMPRSYSDQEK